MKVNKINPGELLGAFYKKTRIYKAALARKMNIRYQKIFYYLKSNTMDIDTLVEFSNALEHNFLLDLAHLLPKSYTNNVAASNEKDDEIAQLKAQILILETEKNTLEKILMKNGAS